MKGYSLRKRIEALEARRGRRGARVAEVVVRFFHAEEGCLAATGHTQAVLVDGQIGPLEPYELTPGEESERQDKLAVLEAERERELLRREPKGVVQ